MDLICCSQVCLSPVARDKLNLGQHTAVQLLLLPRRAECDGMWENKAVFYMEPFWRAVRRTASMRPQADVVWQV